MPQLDFISYFSQVFWLSFFFFFFYSFIFLFTIPFFAMHLKTRFKKIHFQQSFLSAYAKKINIYKGFFSFKVSKFFDFFFSKNIKYSEKLSFWTLSRVGSSVIDNTFYSYFIIYKKLFLCFKGK